jgi:hypothetical protein
VMGSHQARHLGDTTWQSNATAVLHPRTPSRWMRKTKKGKGMRLVGASCEGESRRKNDPKNDKRKSLGNDRSCG